MTRSAGLLAPNNYQSVAIDYLFRHRLQWPRQAAVGKTIVGSHLINRVAASLGRELYEVPVGFKWFVDGLLNGSLAFAGEESAGASFLRRDGKVWTTDKDGIVPALLAAEMTVRTGRDPGELYEALTEKLGRPAERRVQAATTPKQRKLLEQRSPRQFHQTQLAGERIERVLDRAPSNDARLGGLKVITKSEWFAARPSGTENLCKIYAENFRGEDHVERIDG